MMRRVLMLAAGLLVGLAASSLQAQMVSFTLPTPDGKTITANQAGVWSCVQTAYAGLPPGMSFDGTTLKVAKIDTQNIVLSGDTAFSVGPITTVTVPATTLGPTEQYMATLPIQATPGVNIAAAGPVVNGGVVPSPAFHADAVVSGTNEVTLRIVNLSATATLTLPAGSYMVKVF